MGRIVVGIDGSPSSKRALDWAVDYARLRGDVVELVHAYSPPEVHYPYYEMAAHGVQPPSVEDFERPGQRVLDEVLEQLEDKARGVNFERAVVPGAHPARVLVQKAQDADLLVVGSRGRGGFAGLLLGSVSQQCVQHADCPVLVTPSA